MALKKQKEEEKEQVERTVWGTMVNRLDKSNEKKHLDEQKSLIGNRKGRLPGHGTTGGGLLDDGKEKGGKVPPPSA